ncbi:DUF7288 family protein [Natrinema halophilum]|uniref:Uncharacterized protein n=1 Tax=Natrinema halophilum TaxID=1699371 RepID=A0A7D5KKK7_9EURY|nr:hypothetical protein [Natrinema halophilum]QLG50539.1 hypothetical protein HYG82_17655 [Natrinema halophilum]
MTGSTTRETESNAETDRGQAYTLEGFIGAMVVLMAVLFALQSVVLTPTTGGLTDRSVQAQIHQEAQDALLVSNQDGNLSETIRNWDSEGGFENASEPFAPNESHQTYSATDFGGESELGRILNERFTDRGWSYNVHLYPETGERKTLVYQGSPPSSSLAASYTVVLYDNQTLTSSKSGTLEAAAEADEETIPLRNGSDETPIYNVVEVRVILW